jgi:hypothetical protein
VSKLITEKSEKHLYKYHQNLLCIRCRWTQNVIVLWTSKSFNEISNLQRIAMPVQPGNPKFWVALILLPKKYF